MPGRPRETRNAEGPPWVYPVALGALVLANAAVIAVLLCEFAPPGYRFYHAPLEYTVLWVAACAGTVYLLAGLIVDTARPSRLRSTIRRSLALAWMLVPAAILVVRPISSASWDFSDCGTLLGREPAAQHPSANPTLAAFAAECDVAYAHRWLVLALTVAVTIGVAVVLLRFSGTRWGTSAGGRTPEADR